MSLSLFLNYYLLPGIVDNGNKVSDTSEAPCDTAEVNNICFNGSLEDVKETNLIQAPSSDSPTSSFLIESNSPSKVKFGTFSGTKRAAPCLSDTWFRQCLVEKVDELEDELTGKKQKVADGKVFAQNLVKKIDWLLSKTLDKLHLLRENIEDKELLMSKLECLEDKVGRLQQELQKKSHEVEEGSKLQNQLLKQVLANTEMSKYKEKLEECERCFIWKL